MTRSELPIPDYDHLPEGSLTHRIRTLDHDGLQMVTAYEREHAARPHVLQVLQHRLDQLAAGAVHGGSETDNNQPLRHGVAGQTPNRPVRAR